MLVSCFFDNKFLSGHFPIAGSSSQLFSDHQTSTVPNVNALFFLQVNVNNFKCCFEAHMMQSQVRLPLNWVILSSIEKQKGKINQNWP